MGRLIQNNEVSQLKIQTFFKFRNQEISRSKISTKKQFS